MKVNKTQAIYKYLPNSWTTYEEKDGKELFSARIRNWNTIKVQNIYKPKILNEIKRQINSFGVKGGDISEFYQIVDDNAFEFYEPACNEGIADINVTIDPFVFYCPKCGLVHNVKKNLNLVQTCKSCNTKLKQLQMAYSCECGFTKGIQYPYGKDKIYYWPLKAARSQYKFSYYEGQNVREIEMIYKCDCGKRLYPKNASDKIHFVPFTNSSVNLINPKMGTFLEKGHNANLLFIGRWLGFIKSNQFYNILENPDIYFNDQKDEKLNQEVQEMMEMMNVTRDQALNYLKKKSSGGGDDLSAIISKVEGVIHQSSSNNISLLAAQLVEFYALNDLSSGISVEQSKTKSIEVENIIDEKEIDESLNDFGVCHTQLSSNVEIINTAFGYTRLTSSPQNLDEKVKLKLKPFYQNNYYNIFTSVLETEGILIELDRLKVIQWLIDNKIIDNPEITNDIEAKTWFLNHIDLTLINRFSDIEVFDDEISLTTKCVYGLLHSISHMAIKSAGLLSGLDKDSLSELLLPSVPSLFIYSTSIQGLTLGSLSGLFEQNLKNFLDTAIVEYEVCTFDPICSDNHNHSCFACTQVSDVSCQHFNKDLSRAFLFGGVIHLENREIAITKGFWK